MNLPYTPELDRMADVSKESQAIGEFLDWLMYEKEYFICEDWGGYRLEPIDLNIEKILAEYYKIDLQKVAEEKDALVDYVRQQSNSN